MDEDDECGICGGADPEEYGTCCQLLGDMNGDEQWHVDDIVLLVNCILVEECDTLDNGCAGDINGDEQWHVDDIVLLAGQQISNLASGFSGSCLKSGKKNTENRTGARLASIQAISLCFSESSRILRWGSKKNLAEKIKISIFFIISKKSLETSKSQFL